MEAFHQHAEATNAVITTHFQLFLIKNDLKVWVYLWSYCFINLFLHWTFSYLTKIINRLILCTCTLFSYLQVLIIFTNILSTRVKGQIQFSLESTSLPSQHTNVVPNVTVRHFKVTTTSLQIVDIYVQVVLHDCVV